MIIWRTMVFRSSSGLYGIPLMMACLSYTGAVWGVCGDCCGCWGGEWIQFADGWYPWLFSCGWWSVGSGGGGIVVVVEAVTAAARGEERGEERGEQDNTSAGTAAGGSCSRCAAARVGTLRHGRRMLVPVSAAISRATPSMLALRAMLGVIAISNTTSPM